MHPFFSTEAYPRVGIVFIFKEFINASVCIGVCFSIRENYFRNTFLEHAPKSIDKNITFENGRNIVVGGTAVYGVCLLLAPFTGGASLAVGLPALGGVIAGGATATVGDAISSDVGPAPKALAKYVTGYLPGTKRARYCAYDDFWECAKVIRDDLRRGDPVIVFWSLAATSAHYVNVVGVSVDNNDLPEEFIIMDTDNRLYQLGYQDMRFLMKREFAYYALTAATTWDNYHMVRFYR